jgi:hypothetical protein
MQKMSRLQEFLAPWEGLISQLEDLGELAEMGADEGDESMAV